MELTAINGKITLFKFNNGSLRIAIKNEHTGEVSSVELHPEQVLALKLAL